MIVHLDIETRSRADLPEVGAYRYGEDPTTEVMMAAVCADGLEDQVFLWINPKFENAGIKSDPRAFELLAKADKVFAHNAPFELAVMGGTNTGPFIPLDKWRCTAAMARMSGLPESLEKCADALKLDVKKDSKGKALIRTFSIPQEDGSFIDPASQPGKWAEFCEYCRTDVRVEKKISEKLEWFSLDSNRDLLETWLFTLRMNETGIPVNRTALRNAQAIIREVTKETSAEFERLTGLRITQREKVRQWLNAKGLNLENMQSETLEQVVGDQSLPAEARHVVTLYSQLSYAAVKKVETMLDWCCKDNRMRGVFKFYGTNTGRWSAGGPQIQNAKKPTPQMKGITKDAYQAICNGASAQELSAVYGDPLEVISSCIRHFIHQPGSQMLDADYNAIEARIACWIAGESEALDQYRKGMDRYRLMAAKIFNQSAHAVTDEQRALGKAVILGCGYGMGSEKFRVTCQNNGLNISQDLAEQAVTTFRRAHPKVAALWRNLDTAIRAVIESYHSTMVNRSHSLTGGGIVLRVTHDRIADRSYLLIGLPSGRTLAYPDPKIEIADPLKEQLERGYGSAITYSGQLPGTTSWGRIKLYGAKAFENICQAVAADLMSNGAREAEKRWMLPFALIHDQAMAIHSDGQTPDQFASALQSLPPWATGFPLKAEAKLTPYYAK